MLARLQRFLTITLLILAVSWVGFFLARGHPWWALAGPAITASAYIGILGLEFLLLWRSYGANSIGRPQLRQLGRAWFGEVLCGPRVFLWRQPFFSKSLADDVGEQNGQRRGVLFVHGFICNRGLWNPWMKRLRAVRIPFVAVDLEPVFGSIDRYIASIDASVARLERATGTAPVIVAHSMGGLAVRAWLVSDAAAAARVHRVVTIGTPHAGTSMARVARTTNGRQMSLASRWLQQLQARENVAIRERFVCFHGHCDNIVFPTASAMLDGADNRHLAATAHVQMAFHPAVIMEVMRLVSGDSPLETGCATDPERTAGRPPATN